MTIYNEIIIFFWIIFILYWAFSAFSMKKNKTGYGKMMLVRVLFGVVLFAVFKFWPPNLQENYNFVKNINPVLGALGVVLSGVGIGFAIWARTHLGKNWGMPMSVKENPELVTTGPYAYVRHPIYTGVLLAVLGSVVVVGYIWLIMFVFVSMYFIYSAKKEEQIMQTTFPDTYPAYKKRTKMLIPFVF